MSSSLSGVTVVVCCHNSATRLPRTLEHLANQKVSSDVDWEVVVVDNASVDSTARVAADVWSQHGVGVPMRVVAEPQRGLVAARNRGVDEARFEHVLFCDDDNWLHDDYVDLAHTVMSANREVGVLGGRGEAALDAPAPEWFDRYERYYAVGPQADARGDVTDTKGYVYGAGFVIRRSVWQAVRAEGPRSTMEHLARGSDDIEACYLMRLAGSRIWYDDRLRFRHAIPADRLRWDYLLRITEIAHETGVYVAPYRHVLDTLREHGAYLRPRRNEWLRRSARIVPMWIGVRLHMGRTRRGDVSTSEVRARRLAGELRGWLTLRSRYVELCDRIYEARTRLLAGRSAYAGRRPA